MKESGCALARVSPARIFIASAFSLRYENKRFSCCPCQASRFSSGRTHSTLTRCVAPLHFASRRVTLICLRFPGSSVVGRRYWRYATEYCTESRSRLIMISLPRTFHAPRRPLFLHLAKFTALDLFRRNEEKNAGKSSSTCFRTRSSIHYDMDTARPRCCASKVSSRETWRLPGLLAEWKYIVISGRARAPFRSASANRLDLTILLSRDSTCQGCERISCKQRVNLVRIRATGICEWPRK